ncbi:MAG: acetyltransferase [Candidatus Eremiobacterota bacterium]
MTNKFIKALREYNLPDFFRLCFSFFYTRLFYPEARIIRLPFYLRGRKSIVFGSGFTTGTHCRIEAYPVDENSRVLRFGKNVQINDYVHIAACECVTIGDNVLVASKVFISDHNHGAYFGENQDSPDIPPSKRRLVSKPVNIADNVWIGEFVSILPGVSIGKGSIIGTMSVVAHDIPDYSIAVGAPARVIKKYNFISKKWEKVND